MANVIEDIKLISELDDTNVYDDQLLRYVNSGLRYLKNNGIPVTQIDMNSDSSSFLLMKTDDYSEVIDWLGYYTLLRFDRKLDRYSYLNVKEIMNDILIRLKSFYDLNSVSQDTEQLAIIDRLDSLESEITDIQSNQLSVEDL